MRRRGARRGRMHARLTPLFRVPHQMSMHTHTVIGTVQLSVNSRAFAAIDEERFAALALHPDTSTRGVALFG